jgi:hypothetical protein
LNPATDNRFKAFTVEERAVFEQALKALASSGGGDQPIQGGELPPALIGAKPKDAKGVTTMNTEKDIAGATPAVGANSKFSPTDAHNDPGSEDVGIAAKPVGDKGTFSPTQDKDEEAIKALERQILALKTQKAKREGKAKYEELYETWSAGQKAEEGLKAEVLRREEELSQLKEEMGLTNAQSYAPQASQLPVGPAPAVGTAGQATGLKDASGIGAPGMGAAPAPAPAGGAPGMGAPAPSGFQEVGSAISAQAQGSVPKTSTPGQVQTMPPTSPQAIADPTALQEEEDEEALKAMRSAITGLVSKYFGKSFPNGVVEFQKEFDDMLAQVAQPKGGTENLTNVASPGQPPAKVSASPGKSGSSEVFRTDTGKAFEQDDIFDRARKNPAGTLETEKDEPLGTYDESTRLTTGGGYQPALLRGAPKSTFHGRRYEPEIHKSFATRQGYSTNPEEDKLTAKRTLPVLKHLAPSNSISKEELATLEKNGEIVDSLVQKVKPEKDTFLAKNLKRVYG